MKKSENFVMMIAFASFLLVLAMRANAMTDIYVDPVTTQVNEGESFTVRVNMSTEEEVYGVLVQLEFSNILYATEVKEGNFLDKDGKSTLSERDIDNTVRNAVIVWSRTGQVGSVKGDGCLMEVSFDSIGNGVGFLNIGKIEVTDIENKTLALNVNVSSIRNGTVRVNGRPMLDSIGSKGATRGNLITFTINATDPNDDALTYDVNGLPKGATFTNRKFSWIPSYAQSGIHRINFTVSDGRLTDYEVININVTQNVAPEISWFYPADLMLDIFSGYSDQLFNHTSSDSNTDHIIYSWKLNGNEVSTDDWWIFSTDDIDCGMNTITLEVSDGILNDSLSWMVDVVLGGDTNGDHTVSIMDIQTIIDAYETQPTDQYWNKGADVARLDSAIVPGSDGSVDFHDLVYTAWSYGRSC